MVVCEFCGRDQGSTTSSENIGLMFGIYDLRYMHVRLDEQYSELIGFGNGTHALQAQLINIPLESTGSSLARVHVWAYLWSTVSAWKKRA